MPQDRPSRKTSLDPKADVSASTPTMPTADLRRATFEPVLREVESLAKQLLVETAVPNCRALGQRILDAIGAAR